MDLAKLCHMERVSGSQFSYRSFWGQQPSHSLSRSKKQRERLWSSFELRMDILFDVFQNQLPWLESQSLWSPGLDDRAISARRHWCMLCFPLGALSVPCYGFCCVWEVFGLWTEQENSILWGYIKPSFVPWEISLEEVCFLLSKILHHMLQNCVWNQNVLTVYLHF